MGVKAALYSVWRNLPDNDEIVAVDLPARECAKIMGVTMKHFYHITAGVGGNRWTIQKTG